jgi:hypothetical protein
MGLPKADFLIQGFQKKDARLYQLLVLLSNQLAGTQQTISNLVFGPVSKESKRADVGFAQIGEGKLNLQTPLTITQQSLQSLQAAQGTNLLKRISVRI